jgi:hypothetical protein
MGEDSPGTPVVDVPAAPEPAIPAPAEAVVPPAPPPPPPLALESPPAEAEQPGADPAPPQWWMALASLTVAAILFGLLYMLATGGRDAPVRHWLAAKQWLLSWTWRGELRLVVSADRPLTQPFTVLVDDETRQQPAGPGPARIRLATGQRSIRVAAPCYQTSAAQPVTVTAGTPADLSIKLAAAQRLIKIAVIGPDGRPMDREAKVAIDYADWQPYDDYAEGVHTYFVRAIGYATQSDRVVVGCNGADLKIQLRPAPK